MLSFVYEGSATQLGFALLVTLLSKEMLSWAAPYVYDHDDSLANAAEFQIILVFLVGILRFFKSAPEQDGAAGDVRNCADINHRIGLARDPSVSTHLGYPHRCSRARCSISLSSSSG